MLRRGIQAVIVRRFGHRACDGYSSRTASKHRVLQRAGQHVRAHGGHWPWTTYTLPCAIEIEPDTHEFHGRSIDAADHFDPTPAVLVVDPHARGDPQRDPVLVTLRVTIDQRNPESDHQLARRFSGTDQTRIEQDISGPRLHRQAATAAGRNVRLDHVHNKQIRASC